MLKNDAYPHYGIIYFPANLISKTVCMKKTIILLFAFLMCYGSGSVRAQVVGPVGIGVRASPDGGGISAKFFFNENLAVETMVNGSAGNYHDNGTSFTVIGLLEYHFILPDPSWRIILGGGMHFGSWNRYGDAHVSAISVFGLDAIAGVEYIIPSIPIGVSLDVKPAMHFLSGVTTFPNNTFGLGVRYYLGRWKHERTTVYVEENVDNDAPMVNIVPTRD
jgi:hypothetical protein